MMLEIYSEDNLKKLYSDLGSGPRVAEFLNAPYKVVARYLKKYGITNKQHVHRKINEDYFTEIDTEYRAYFLGLFFADGYVSQDKQRFQINISNKQSYILEKFVKDSNSSYEIQPYTVRVTEKEYPSARLVISNSRFIDHMISKGVIPGKINRILLPVVKDDLLLHFIRGMFDADGCFSWSHTQRKTPVLSLDFCGYYNTMEQLGNILEAKGFMLTMYKQGSIFRLTTAKRQTVYELGHAMYNNATIYLQYKRDRYNDFVNKYYMS